jgi:hypothetical protein
VRKFLLPVTLVLALSLGIGALLGGSGAVYVPSQIDDIVGLRGALGINVKDTKYGAKGDGVANDTTPIQNAINDASTAGGGIVYLPSGTYLVSGLQMKSNVELVGAGKFSTTLKLANGSNADVVGADSTNQGFINIQAANGTSNAGGIIRFTVSRLCIDGNLANNTSGFGLRLYGYGYRINSLIVRNCAGGGILTDWNSGAGASDAEQMMGNIEDVKIHDCGGVGLTIGGPHDSNIINADVWNVHQGGVWAGPNASALKFHNVHTYSVGNQGTFNAAAFGWLMQGGYAHVSACISEGNRYGGWIILNGDSQFTNCHGFSYNTFASAGPMLVLGQAGTTTYGNGSDPGAVTVTGAQACNSVLFDGWADHLESTTSGPLGTGGVVQFVNSNGHNRLKISSFQQAGLLYTGTPSNSDQPDFVVNGITADGTVPMGGQKRVVTNSTQGFLVTDGSGNDAFNVNVTNKQLQAPNNGKITAYTTGYSAIGTQLNYDGAGGIQIGNTTVIQLTKRAGALLGINGTITLAQSSGVQTIANGSTISVSSSGSQVGVNRVTESGPVTGVIMSAGAASGQVAIVLNEGSNAITFAIPGTSNVANGASVSVNMAIAKVFVWDSITALWYPTN